MKFSSRTEIDAPPTVVFERLSDFERIESLARERGVKVERLDDGSEGPSDARWRIDFDYRGRSRSCDAAIAAYVPGEQIAGRGELEGLSIFGNVELVEYDPGKTRMFCTVDLKPSSMRARLLVQSLKLAKGTLDRRFAKRLNQFGKRLETT
ncbi:Polyketide cyclase / dehydrase and lipid transport [Rhodobacteraceae bacterium THAF1]|uniref:SRPBCC family protein n=1 Tax=Palleronia sp. THAF1 TaxID=2587842 RepID=UPI000F3EE864|nr:SRPBCC family protein [Palleronia sp. THAF1]QFU09713.1 Polyketide cyclase / dehydrase and lipid transport [Palleronia sp. THAF1]VDC17384.1 Polyketide cyclase / dehydrase and lipid transport [Rhodobacteraceae bacterium THAF1]